MKTFVYWPEEAEHPPPDRREGCRPVRADTTPGIRVPAFFVISAEAFGLVTSRLRSEIARISRSADRRAVLEQAERIWH